MITALILILSVKKSFHNGQIMQKEETPSNDVASYTQK